MENRWGVPFPFAIWLFLPVSFSFLCSAWVFPSLSVSLFHLGSIPFAYDYRANGVPTVNEVRMTDASERTGERTALVRLFVSHLVIETPQACALCNPEVRNFCTLVSVQTAGGVLLSVKPTDDWIIRSTSPFRSEVSDFKAVGRKETETMIQIRLYNHQYFYYTINISISLNFRNL